MYQCCFLAMRMGWFWAFFCYHRAISTALETAVRQRSLPLVLVGDLQSPAVFNREAPAVALCVDIANLIALTRESGDRFSPFLSRSSGGQASCYVMRLSPARMLRSWAWCSTEPRDVCVTQVATAGAFGMHSQRCCRCDAPPMPFACVGSHHCHHLGLFPPALSLLEEIFPWSLQHVGRIELRVAPCLLFVTGSNLWRDLGERMFCSDPSSRGYAPLESPACAQELCRWKERWRLREMMSQ